MDLNTQDKTGFTVLNLKGKLSLDSAAELKDRIQKYLEKPSSGIILNFEKVPEIDSSGLSIIVAIHKQLAQVSDHLALSQVNLRIQELFTLTKLDRFLLLAHDDEDAMALLKFLTPEKRFLA